MRVRVRPPRRGLAGTVHVPGDKSISHRAALVGAVAAGRTEVSGFLEGDDCLATLRAVQALGVEVTRKGPGEYAIDGMGLAGLQEPEAVLDCGNSGTTARLLLGLLAGQPFWSFLTGDDSLRRRPMGRVTEPLARMGATVVGRGEGGRLPLGIRGARPLRGLVHRTPVASAQVKSALLLAGLAADGPTVVEEPAPSRDHTERMLRGFGARVRADGTRVTLSPGGELSGRAVRVPGDISSAAFFLVAGALVPGSALTVSGVGVNPTRTGLLDVLGEMGASLSVTPRQEGEEPVADLAVRPGALRGARVGGALIPRLIDELPVLAVAAALAKGVTEVREAAELRVKESDRIATLARELGKLGARIEERPDGFAIEGGRPLQGGAVRSWGDHRMAMALIVAGLAARGETVVEEAECVAVSYPGFLDALNALAPEPCALAEP
jgi:3-phosphoshikimate 1-carboxyvinyltransferase